MAPNVRFVRATDAHAVAMAPHMRAEDIAECAAVGLIDSLDTLRKSLALSDVAYAMLIDDEVAVLFGVAPLRATTLGAPTVGVVWALTSEAVNRHPREFVKWSRPALSVLLDYCPHLVNFMDARYYRALRWARWVGFDVGPEQPHGPLGAPFCPITVRRDSHV